MNEKKKQQDIKNRILIYIDKMESVFIWDFIYIISCKSNDVIKSNIKILIMSTTT